MLASYCFWKCFRVQDVDRVMSSIYANATVGVFTVTFF
jgi:hypothetical protein